MEKPLSYQDREVVGLDREGRVVQWNAAEGKPYSSGVALADWGIHNLREQEIDRVGVSREQWAAAAAQQVKLVQKEYLFYIEGLNREIWQAAESEKAARKAVWSALGDEQNCVVQIECIDERYPVNAQGKEGKLVRITTEGPLDDLTVTGADIPEDQLTFALQAHTLIEVVNQDNVRLRLSFDMDGDSLVAEPIDGVLSDVQRDDYYNQDKFPYFVCHHGNWDIYANEGGYCAAIPNETGVVAGSLASHFGGAAFVQKTFGVDVVSVIAKRKLPALEVQNVSLELAGNEAPSMSGTGLAESDLTAEWMETSTSGVFEVSAESLVLARQILVRGWHVRAAERGGKIPADLDGACKFATLFCKLAFGGVIAGSHEHQFNVLNGERIDLVGIEKYNASQHDAEFFGNDEHVESMRSCLPRVRHWLNDLQLELAQLAAGKKLPADASLVEVVIDDQHPAEPKTSAHYPFYRALLDGKPVYRDDIANGVKEWITLDALDGDASKISRYGYNDLAIPGVTLEKETVFGDHNLAKRYFGLALRRDGVSNLRYEFRNSDGSKADSPDSASVIAVAWSVTGPDVLDRTLVAKAAAVSSRSSRM